MPGFLLLGCTPRCGIDTGSLAQASQNAGVAVHFHLHTDDEGAALFRAITTGAGTSPTVVHLILVALRLTTLADVDTGLAYGSGCGPATPQVIHRQAADFGAVDSKRHAIFHGVDICLMPATLDADITCGGTGITG